MLLQKRMSRSIQVWGRDPYQCLRPSLLGQDQKIGLSLGLAGLVLCCETRSCYACRHNDL